MLCGTCKHFIADGQRYKVLADGAYVKANVGKCCNPVVMDLVSVKQKTSHAISVITHSNQFDESFGCIYKEPDTNKAVG
jgi:hypothetical protein